jgi:hypothetical protein
MRHDATGPPAGQSRPLTSASGKNPSRTRALARRRGLPAYLLPLYSARQPRRFLEPWRRRIRAKLAHSERPLARSSSIEHARRAAAVAVRAAVGGHIGRARVGGVPAREAGRGRARRACLPSLLAQVLPCS